MTYTKIEGYLTAADIDDLLNAVLTKHDLTDRNNAGGYLALIRTVQTSFRVIEAQLHNVKCPTCGK